jgi:cell division protein FtsQ
MLKKENILKILTWLLWGSLCSGILVLLVSAVNTENSVTCARVEITIEGKSNLKMVTADEISASLWPEGSGIQPVGKKIPDFNLFDLEQQIEKNPWVADADVFFDHHRVMHIKVFQRTPVARLFLPDGASVYLDARFRTLPLKTTDVLKLPVFTNFTLLKRPLSASDSATMARIVGLSNYIMADEFWMAQIETVHIQYDGSFELTMQLGDETVLLGKRGDWDNLLPKLKLTYEKFAHDQLWGKYRQIDLQFKDQVICRKSSGLQMITDTTNKDSVIQ